MDFWFHVKCISHTSIPNVSAGLPEFLSATAILCFVVVYHSLLIPLLLLHTTDRQNHCVHYHHHHHCHHAFKTKQCCCSRPGCIPNSHNYIRCRTIIGSFYRNFSSPLSPYLIAYSLLLSPLSLPTYNAAMGEFLIGMCRTKQLQSIGLMCVHKKCKCSNLDRGYK